jgi:hypothetical protein
MTQKIGPREQQLREQREQAAKEHETKTGRPRTRVIKPEIDKDLRKQLSATKANRKRKDRQK